MSKKSKQQNDKEIPIPAVSNDAGQELQRTGKKPKKTYN